MAVLKDLIVHGSSRFLNGIYSDSIHSDLIDANSGVFRTITTTTLDAGTITTDMLKANNARVAQTLTVDGTISTNKWEAASIANIGGNFYISPTGKSDSGTITVTKTGSTTINGVSVGVYTLVVSGTFGVTSTNDTIWGNNSKVIFTGSISYNDSKKFPLGSCSGTMTTKTTGTNTLTGFTITGVNSSTLDIFFKEVGITSVSSTACNGYEMQISVYQSYSNSNLRPVGILLTSYGKEKKQYIDIYGGSNVLGDADSGFADPEVRIGQLDGLPNIVDGSTSTDTKPTGWGIYTTNGFFKGKIVANAGRVGNWVIENGSSTYGGAIYTGSFGSDNGIFITPSYTSSTAIGGSSGSQNWTMTASNKFGVTKTGYLYASKGKIAGWTIDTNKIYSGTHSTWNSTAEDGLYLGNDGIAGGSGGIWYLWKDGSAKIGAMTLSAAGVLAVPAANITGTLTASQIDVSGVISSGGIVTNTLTGGTFNTADYIRVSTQASSSLTIGTSGAKTDWRIIAGKTFGVDKAGVLYATDAHITGAIKATSFIAQDYYNGTYRDRVVVDTNGLTVYDGSGISVANFGSVVTIGKSTSSTDYNIYIDNSSINLRKQNKTLMSLASDYLLLTDTIYAGGTLQEAKYFTIVSGNDNKIFNKARVDLATIDTPTSSSNTYTLSEWSGQVSDLHFYVCFNTYYTSGGGEKGLAKLRFVKGESLTHTYMGINVSYNKDTSQVTISVASNGNYEYGGDIYYLYNISRDSYPGYILGYLGEYGGLGKYGVHLGEWNQALGESSISEGYSTTAQGDRSHAEGSYTVAYGMASHSEGEGTDANGRASHSEGQDTRTVGIASHSEGQNTRATGIASHAQNKGTIAQGQYQTAIGKYNIAQGSTESISNTDYAFIIGNGSSFTPSNALTVDWNGVLSCRRPNVSSAPSAVKNEFASIFDLIYPVGSIYMSINDTSPSYLFGGEWTVIQGRFLLAAGTSENTTYIVGQTGGSKDAVIVSHSHEPSDSGYRFMHAHASLSGGDMSGPSGSGRHYPYLGTRSDGAYWGSGTTTASTGVSGTDKNMPPYTVVYMWERTA